VTGASLGRGAALGLALADTHHILAVGRTVGALEELDDRIKSTGGEATLAPLDITDDGAMQHLCRSTYERWGKVDLWAHTAIHATPLMPAHMIDTKGWDKSLAINVEATRRLIAYVAPLLDPATGHALFFEDRRGGEPFCGAYGATKSAQIALARSWAAETAKTGPKVHILNPMPMRTAVRARFHPGEDRAGLAHPRIEAARLLAQV